MATTKPANPEEVIELVRAGSALARISHKSSAALRNDGAGADFPGFGSLQGLDPASSPNLHETPTSTRPPFARDEFCEISGLVVKGGGTKPSLWEVKDSTTVIDMTGLSGIVEYQPSEYTITVRSGTRLQTVVEALGKNGQYLPFDPPLADQGATIGGTVAAGLSGPGAYRYGPLKDFIIGIRFVDGLGNHVRGGGNVVKNAAGFDFPKLFNGSLGRLGILTEVSFKVFPKPQRYVTLQARLPTLEEAGGLLPRLKGFDLEGVELDSTFLLSLRLGYQQPTMAARRQALESLVERPLRLTLEEEESTIWRDFKHFSWQGSHRCLFKVATHPASALRLIRSLKEQTWQFHLGNGGKALYLACREPAEIDSLDGLLQAQKLTGLQLKGPVSSHPIIGEFPGSSFVNRLQKALDPNGIFPSFSPADPLPA